MELQDIYFVAEIFGVVAIIGSLIFVGIQMRQNTSAMKIESHQKANELWTNMSMPLVTNERFATLFAEDVHPDLRAVGYDADQVSLSTYMGVSFSIIESHYLRWLEGNLPDEIWSTMKSGLLEFLTLRQSSAEHWRFARDFVSPEFRSLVDQLVPLAGDRRKEYLDQMMRGT